MRKHHKKLLKLKATKLTSFSLLFLLWIVPGLAQVKMYGDTMYPQQRSTDSSVDQDGEVSPYVVAFTDWNVLGMIGENDPPYNLYYYKLLRVNADDNAHRYASMVELNVEGDDNYYQMQGTYRIRITKYEGSGARFDGLEIQCISGNPNAATFYIYNNALWLRANYNRGEVYYRTVADFSYWSTTYSPLVGAPFGQMLTAPTGYLASTNNYGVKCDFDHNIIYRLPYIDANGNIFTNGNVGIGTTTPQSKLAVNGTITAKQVKVTQAGWPDYVFDLSFMVSKLNSVESFIKLNHHFQDIPFVAEIARHGLDLGDIQNIWIK